MINTIGASSDFDFFELIQFELIKLKRTKNRMKKKVLITGASKGIGKAIAENLINDGKYDVYGTSRNPDNVKDKNDRLTLVKLDVTKIESIQACSDQIGNIDILINNAGQSQLGAAEDTSIVKYKELFDVNFFGVVGVTNIFLPSIRNNKGKIINIGSLIGTFNLPYYSSYTASKSALQGYSHSLRMELLKFGVQVTLIEPNDFATSIEPEVLCKESSVYTQTLNIIREKIRANMSKSESPDVIGKFIVKLLTKQKLKAYYPYGGNAKMLTILKRMLPHEIVHKLTMQSYNL
ncbi:SDR family oxidoreductase [Chondrinema litorale]|uniref:SDR family oxidoreductase n=1 Tax=Chondrinema litorale TaxID=2994555 RepID=UPI002543D93D|nr:SDR family oxidoreductase [Chondrinema litorale]UZR99003.1 SDR family oxidoreductase [Chondrinema litorale]